MTSMTLISRANSRQGDFGENGEKVTKEVANEDEVEVLQGDSSAYVRPTISKGVRINPGQIFWQGRYVDQTMFYKELVGSSTSDRNWKGIAIAIAVILLVLLAVAVSVFVMTPPDTGPKVKGMRFSIKQLVDQKLMPRMFNGSWMSDKELLLRDHRGGLSIYDVETSRQTVVITSNIFRRYEVSKYSISSNKKFVLFAHKLEKRHRYSSWAYYSIFEVNSGLIWDVSSKRDNDPDQDETSSKRLSFLPTKLLYAEWLPSKDMSSPMIFIDNFTLYYIADVAEQNPKVVPISLPEQVIPEVLINGIPDWTYEEEILKRDNAVWISPDGEKLVFATFNDTMVDEVTWKIYGSPIDGVTNPYPQEGRLRYPKAGSKNPTFSLWLVNITSSQMEKIRPPLLFRDIEHYFSDVSWIDSNSVSVAWTNRPQNLSIITQCRPPSWICKETYRESVGSNAWSILGTTPRYSRNGASFLTLVPLRDGDNGIFSQIGLIETVQSHLVHPITFGNFEVDEILAWNEDSGTIYFRAIPQISPSEKHIYTISDRWKSGPQQPECLTCMLQEQLNKTCLYNNAKFSPRQNYFILECLGPDVPASYLMRVNPGTSTLKSVTLLDNNSETLEASNKLALPTMEKLIIKLPGENRIARGKLYLPPELRPEESITFPMVIHVDASPKSQLVTEEWKLDFNTYLASGLSYIVLEVDASGSGGQGQRKVSEVKNKLGQLEVQDQLDAIRFIVGKYPFVDPERISVFGQGYGGYVAGLMLADRVRNHLRCGIAIAPIVDWRLYVSTFTERYMGFPVPTDNYRGYQDGSFIARVKNIKGKGFFLAHGMADKKVHFQNSVLLAKSLVDNNIPFEQHFYADEGHSLNGVKTHLHASMSIFLQKCFFKSSISEEDDGITYEHKKGHLIITHRDDEKVVADLLKDRDSGWRDSF